MANAIPVQTPGKKEVKKDKVEIVGTLPEGFEVPANAKRVVVEDNGSVSVAF